MHGSARWATYREVRRGGLSRLQAQVGVMQEQTFYDNGLKHVFLCAPTRAGKGVFYIQPTLQTGWRQSALILDPKRGENYDLTHRARSRRQAQLFSLTARGENQCAQDHPPEAAPGTWRCADHCPESHRSSWRWK